MHRCGHLRFRIGTVGPMDRNQAARDRLAAAWAAKAKAKATAKAEAKAKAIGLSPGVVPGQVEWEETEIEKTKRLLARRRP